MDLSSITSLTNIPLLYAFVIGVVIAINPCNMGVNIAGIAYISLKMDSPREAVFSGILYTIGRAFTYAIFGMLIFAFGSTISGAAPLLQTYENVILGLAMVLIGVVMLDLIKLNTPSGGNSKDRFGLSLANKGAIGSVAMGAVSSLAFCPCTAVIFFGLLMPLSLETSVVGISFPTLFGLGTGVPVLSFALLMGMSTTIAQAYLNNIMKYEPFVRKLFGAAFILYGAYLLVLFLTNML